MAIHNKVLLFGFLVLLIGGAFAETSYADDVTFSAEIESALNLSLSDNAVSLLVNPQTTNFVSDSMSATVRTNNPYGYTLNVRADGTDLIRTTQINNEDVIIPTLALNEDGYNESGFLVNHWGYRTDNGNYRAFTGLFELGSTAEPTNEDVSTLDFALKADYEQPAGIYNIELEFVVVAKPEPVMMMQNLSAALCTETPLTVKDSRDGTEYVVQKLHDGGCWMMENLRLNGGVTLDETNTDIGNGSTYTLRENTTAIDESYTEDRIATLAGSDEYGHVYGNLYNYCAASAGTMCTDQFVTEVNNSSICPAGWTMPKGQGENEFTTLLRAYGYVDDDDSYMDEGESPMLKIIRQTLGFTLEGDNGMGHYWTRATGDSMYPGYADVFMLMYGDSMNGINPGSSSSGGSAPRTFGAFVRCYLKAQPQALTYMQDADASKMAVLMPENDRRTTMIDRRDNTSYTVAKLADGNYWMTKELTLEGENGGSMLLTSEDSDVETDFLLKASGMGANQPDSYGDCTVGVWTSGSNVNDYDVSHYCSRRKYYTTGTFYNWYAATAGTGTYSLNDGSEASGSICPKGWRLPSVSGNKSYHNLLTDEMGFFGGGASFWDLTGYPLNFRKGGSVSGNGRGETTVGYYWTSTSVSGTAEDAYFFKLKSSNDSSDQASGSKNVGRFIRCIFDGQ